MKLHKVVRNARDKTGSAQALGQQAEDKFIIFAQNKGFNVKPSTKQEDVFAHVDYLISKDNKTYSVDVKSEKKVNRGDGDTQNELIWIEFLNVKGHDGWLYGKAKYIAFQDGDSYLMIPREKLVARVNSLVTGLRARNASDALYKLYTRFQRQDLLTMIKKSDIIDLHEEI